MFRKNITIFCLVFLSSQLFAQQDLSLHFMTNLMQSNYTNPASFHKYRIAVSLPSPYLNYYNPSFRPNDIFEKSGNTLNLKDLGVWVGGLKDTGNKIQANVNLETIGISVQFAKFQLTLNHSTRFGLYANLPKGLFELAWEGNAAMLNQEVQIAPQIDVLAYHEFGLGFAYKVGEKLKIGARFKYLNGIGSFNTERTSAIVQTNSEYYQLNIMTDAIYNFGGVPIDFESGEIEEAEISSLFFNKNKGFALDFGGTYKLNNKLTIQASVTDLGKIAWKENVSNQTSKGEYYFEGLDLKSASGETIEEMELDFEGLTDSIIDIFSFQETHNNYTTNLPSIVRLSATFAPIKSFRLGALFFGEMYRSQFSPALALSVQKDLGKIFSVGAVYSMREKSFSNVGINMAFRVFGIQLYALSDNVIPLFNEYSTKNFNLRFGINIAILGKKKETI